MILDHVISHITSLMRDDEHPPSVPHAYELHSPYWPYELWTCHVTVNNNDYLFQVECSAQTR